MSRTQNKKIPGRFRLFAPRWLLVSVFWMFLTVSLLLIVESHTSLIQARYLSNYASTLSWKISDQAGDLLSSPQGPYDIRQGYAALPRIKTQLVENGYRVTRQAIPSAALYKLGESGIAPPYKEHSVGTLRILDARGNDLYRAITDRFHFRDFMDLPPLVIKALLHVENRSLLDDSRPHLNPALEWDRLVFAGWNMTKDRLLGNGNRAGGSTLATQIQKFRHSKDGRTRTVREKVLQMAAASLSAYRGGADTREVRHQLVVDYFNSLPLGARPGVGEITGLGDGMWAWFRKTPEDLAVDLARPEEGDDLIRKATTFKQALALILATRRPAWYLGKDHKPLEKRLQFYLSDLERSGVITPRLATRARQIELQFEPTSPKWPRISHMDRKAINRIRTELLDLLSIKSFYDLDRLDLRVESTIDVEAQNAAENVLRNLNDPTFLKANNFYGKRLLKPGNDPNVIYVFSLYEATEAGNKLLVTADNFDGPLNLNNGTKLEMGSTAKLRTTSNYLMIIADLYNRHHMLGKRELRKIERDALDPLTRWAARDMRLHSSRSLQEILQRSLARELSANSNTKFFTGGGMHRFANFNHRFQGKTSIRTAMQHSVNLVLVRLMSEVVQYYTAELGYDEAAILKNVDHSDRKDLLRAAIDRESRQHLWSMYKQYKGLTYLEAKNKLARTKGKSRQPQLIEHWLVKDRQSNPNPEWLDVAERSATVRLQAYQWVFHSTSTRVQNRRIRTQLERLAFSEIHKSWRQLGYPFDALVPSLATAIGSSADRPQALAELMGIIQNGGRFVPTVRVQALHFAEGTPYEIHFETRAPAPQQVMPREATYILRELLQEVVEEGTARRVKGALQNPMGGKWVLGGKTGSGDNRYKTYDKRGRLLEDRPINRTASFVFYVGERHFGTILAYVPGRKSGEYSFTSSLALQAFRTLSPAIERALDRHEPPASIVSLRGTQ